MQKNNKGYMLAETLIVTTFVAGVLIFLFMQFSKLSASYGDYYTYNTTEGLYALEDIKDYIESDSNMYNKIKNNITFNNYINITNCDYFTNKEYCNKLLELENISEIYVMANNTKVKTVSNTIDNFLGKINSEGNETYRIVAKFNDGKFATIRFGEGNILYSDSTINGSDPILFDDTLTPVIYNGNNWVVADKSTKWYDYENQEWANAVILKNSKNIGEVVNVEGFNSDIYAMYVWVPRYEYKISDAASSTPKEISVNFISKDTTIPSDGYAINSGFTFGSTNLSGIWVGKFETSHVTLSSSSSNNNLNCQNESCTSADNLRVVPNVQSLRYNNVSNNFFASRSMGRSGNPFGIDNTLTDSHMMKNSEWGIVAYLSQSKYGKYGNSDYSGANKEVYINNSSSYYTGRSGGGPGGSTPINEMYTSQESTEQYVGTGFYTYDDYLLDYNTNTKGSKVSNKGTGASTTGNIYGVYDMSGGATEYVMGVFANSSYTSGTTIYLWSGNSTTYNSGFTGKLGSSGDTYEGVVFPNAKYYDVYKASSGTTMTQNKACNGGICYGHAVSPEVANWYGDYSHFVSAAYPWFLRGGSYSRGASAGVMAKLCTYGYANSGDSFRLVLSET